MNLTQGSFNFLAPIFLFVRIPGKRGQKILMFNV
jgi:hypothetical protein